ncbi:MAG: hypothetical protein KJ645_02530, partial [Planctomycetes bacterium]|nr:hypothetical protein [Planctomycetota bacterium]
GVVLTAMLKKKTAAIVVGEAAGAPYNFFSDMRSKKLPNSGLKLWVATLFWQHGNENDKRPIIPVDHEIRISAQEFFSGKDPVLEAVIRDDYK